MSMFIDPLHPDHLEFVYTSLCHGVAEPLLATIDMLARHSVVDDYTTSKIMENLLRIGASFLQDFWKLYYSEVLNVACEKGLLATAHVVSEFMLENGACTVRAHSLAHELKTLPWTCEEGRHFIELLLEEVESRTAAVNLISMKRKRNVF